MPAEAPNRRHPRLRRAATVLAALAALGGVTAAAPTAWAQARSAGRVRTVEAVPSAPVAIIFGAQVHASGMVSRFLEARLAAGLELYRSGKVRALVVSGDNDEDSHYETDHMRDWLIEQGVPPSRVVADPFGYDTYDTCARAAQVYRVERAILVTQAYHAPRAVATCRELGVDAFAVGDESVRDTLPLPWNRGVRREWPASFKMVLDLASRRGPVVGGSYDPAVDEAARI